MHERLKLSRAFSLIEVAIVLALVGLVIGGLWTVAAAVSRHQKINQLLEDVLIVSQNLRSKYSQVDITDSLWFYDTAVPNRLPKSDWAAFLPPHMIGSAPEPTSSFGDTFSINIYGSVAPPRALRLTINLPDVAA